jgi:hypothetical protein
LAVSKRELTEVIELLQQVRPNDLSQTRALLSLMVAILSDMPKSRESMRENAGFLTLITVLASLGTDIVSEPESTITTEDEPESESSFQRRIPSISINSDSQLGPFDSPKSGFESPQSKYSELQEERDAVATLVFKCLALALSNHRENQLFFSTKLGFKLVLDALRLSNFIPQSPSGDTHYRRRKIEKLFGILFAFIAADFSCVELFSAVRIKFNQQRETNMSSQNLASRGSDDSSHSNAQPASGSGHGANAASIPTNHVDSDSKYSKMAELLRQIILDRLEHLRVEIADAVLLLFALHADLFNSIDSSSLESLEDNYDLYFLSLKAIEILATGSRHSQIALNSIELTAVILERLALQSSSMSPLLGKKPQANESKRNPLPSAGLEPWNPNTLVTGSEKITNRHGDRQCRQVAKAIVAQMLQVGTSPREARMLFRQAVRRHEAGSSGKEVLDEDYLELM